MSSPPPVRRRSSFFERQATAPVETPQTDSNLSNYSDTLAKEIEQWNQIYNQRKDLYRSLKKKCTEGISRPDCSDGDELSEETARFLSEKPDLSAIRAQCVELCQDVHNAVQVYRHFAENDRRVRSYVEHRVDAISSSILERSVFE